MLGVLVFFVAQHGPAGAKAFPLTVESIMRGYALVGHAPRALRWAPDGSQLTFTWAKADGTADPGSKDYVVKRDGTGLKPGNGSDWPTPAAPPSAPQPKPAREVYLSAGDIYLREAGAAPKRLTTNAGLEDEPRLSKDGATVAYMKSGALYSIDVASGNTTLLADSKSLSGQPATAGSGSSTPSENALATEETELFHHFPTTSSIPETAGARNRGRFQDGPSLSGLNLDPSGNHAMVTIFWAAPSSRSTEVPAFVTRSGYTEFIRSYPKVGEPEGSSRLLLVDIKNGAKSEIAPPDLAGSVLFDGPPTVCTGSRGPKPTTTRTPGCLVLTRQPTKYRSFGTNTTTRGSAAQDEDSWAGCLTGRASISNPRTRDTRTLRRPTRTAQVPRI